MNHDAPMTPAAMQAHIAELEQQLKLSDGTQWRRNEKHFEKVARGS